MIPQNLTPAILEGDVLDMLRGLPDDSIHCVVTSPPVLGTPRLRPPTGPMGREGAV